MSTVQRWIGWLLGVGCIAALFMLRWCREPVPPAPVRPVSVEGVVLREGAPTSATVALHRYLLLDAAHPYAQHEGIARYTESVRAPAGSKPPIAVQSTSSGGRFRFEGLAAGLYEVHVRHASDAHTVEGVAVGVPGVRAHVVAHVPTQFTTLKGRVVAEGPLPAGLLVRVQPFHYARFGEWPSMTARVVRPAADGRFSVSGLAPGEMGISVGVPDEWQWHWGSMQVPHPDEVRVELPSLEPSAAESGPRGRVVDALTGEPIVGAHVATCDGHFRSIGWTCMLTTSDAQGRFRTARPRGGGIALVRAEGYALAGATIPEGEDESRPLVVRLWPAARVEGRVVNAENGRPVAGVPVYVGRRGNWAADFPLPRRAVADRRGRFVLEGLRGFRWDVVACGGGWDSPGLMRRGHEDREYHPHAYDLEPGETTRLVLEVERAGSVEGRVLDAGGHPVAGALVVPGHQTILHGLGGGMFLSALGLVGTATDADGRYRLDTLPATALWHLQARLPGHAWQVSEALRVVPGETAVVDFTIPDPLWIDLTVRDEESGTPVRDAEVVATGPWELTALQGRLEPRWRTDAHGRAHVGPLPSADITLHLSAVGASIEGARRSIPEARLVPGLPLTIALQKGRTLRGRIVLPEGMPWRPLWVRVNWDSEDYDLGRRARARADSTFEVEGVPPLETYLSTSCTWQGRDYAAEATLPATTDSADLVLRERPLPTPTPPQEMRTVLVRVRAADGTPLRDGWVSATAVTRESKGESHGARVRAGEARVDAASAGSKVWFEIVAPPLEGSGSALVGPVEASKQEIDVRLGPARTIRGTLRSAARRPLRAIVVAAKRLGVGGPDVAAGETLASTLTDARGAFVLRGLGEGRYRLSCTVPGHFLAPEAVTATAGEDDVVLDLAPALGAAVRVLDAAGEPITGAQVSVKASAPEAAKPVRRHDERRRRGLECFTETDAYGYAYVDGLAPGVTFLLEVTPDRSVRDFFTVERSEWTPRDETIQVERAHRVRGSVQGVHGRPFTEAVVLYGQKKDGGRPREASVDKHGGFVIHGLRRGPLDLVVRLEGTPGDYNKPWRGTAGRTVVAPDEDVLFVVEDLGPALTVRVLDGAAPVDYGSVDLWRQGNDPYRTSRMYLDAAGRATFPMLEADARYTLWLHSQDGAYYVLERDLQPQDEEVAIRVRRGGTITGRIQRAAGTQGGYFYVKAKGPEHPFVAEGRAEDNGQFSIDGLPEGTWEIEGRWLGRGRGARAYAKAKTGDADVKIQLE